ncbi:MULTISPECIES: glycosyltransferase [unclassified Microcoleus]|uniref:glycosyltransferase n=1 Tax=unclassified Microcoleus TaxID=2642155 RepID=UPI00403FA982
MASLNQGVPFAVMEAMAMQVPAVVTNVGGTSELVDDGADAILVQSEKLEEMADAIANLLQNLELALSLSQESGKKSWLNLATASVQKLGITNPS